MNENKLQTDYRTTLSRELIRRVKANPAYSLRRFAKQLGMSPATLSGVLSSKRRLSIQSAAKIGDKLGLPPNEAQNFLHSVVSELSQTDTSPKTKRLPEFMQLTEEAFQVISEWHHYAILELTTTPGCKADARWFAKKLDIPHAQAADAIHRLLELGFLEKKNNTFKKTMTHFASPNGVPSSAVRKRHKQIFEKAIASLEKDPIEDRDMSSMTMAIDPALLPEATKRIAEFRRNLCTFLESGTQRRVFEISIALFPLSRKEEV